MVLKLFNCFIILKLRVGIDYFLKLWVLLYTITYLYDTQITKVWISIELQADRAVYLDICIVSPKNLHYSMFEFAEYQIIEESAFGTAISNNHHYHQIIISHHLKHWPIFEVTKTSFVSLKDYVINIWREYLLYIILGLVTINN